MNSFPCTVTVLQIRGTNDKVITASAWILKPLFVLFFGHFLLRKDQLSLLMQLPHFVIFAYGSKHKTLWMMLTLLIMILQFLSLGTVSEIAIITQLGETNASVSFLRHHFFTIPLIFFIDNWSELRLSCTFQSTDYQYMSNYSECYVGS